MIHDYVFWFSKVGMYDYNSQIYKEAEKKCVLRLDLKAFEVLDDTTSDGSRDYRISAPAHPASGPFLEIRLQPEFWPDLGQLSRMVIFLTTVLELPLESSTSVSSSEQSMDKQTGSSLWNCFDTIGLLQVSVAAESTTDGNCISTDSDQFLSEPLIRMILLPVWWKVNMHRFPQLSPLAQKFLSCSERLFSTAAWVLPENADFAETLILKFNSLLLDVWHFLMLDWLIWPILALILLCVEFWTRAIKIYHLMLIIDNAKWPIWLTLALVLLCVELNSQIRFRLRLRPHLSWKIRPDPAPDGFGKVKSGTSLHITVLLTYFAQL